MGKVTILEETIKNPIRFMGKRAGRCWGADITDNEKNYKRGLTCIKSGHGRVMEYAVVHMDIEGYSARVIREFYTHIGGGPTRLQSSTRYIDYAKGFDFVMPHSVAKNPEAAEIYKQIMVDIQSAAEEMIACGIPKEDANTILPLSMTTTIACSMNSRTLMDMSRKRECQRAYWEFRELFRDIRKALSEYSDEWKTLVEMSFAPQCEVLRYCPEANGCGRYAPKKILEN